MHSFGARSYDQLVGTFISADTVQGNLAGDDPYAYVGGNPESLSDPTGQLIVASCYSQGCGIQAIPRISSGSGSALAALFQAATSGVGGSDHPSSKTAGVGDANNNTGPACNIGCRSSMFVDNGSYWTPVRSVSTPPTCLSLGSFGLPGCVYTGGVGGISYIRVNLPPSTINYCPPPVGCGGDGNNDNSTDNGGNKDSIVFADATGPNGEPQATPTENAQAAAGEAADKTPIDLYRSGNSTSPRLDNVRAGREFNTDPNGNEVLYPDQTPHPNGLSTFENQGIGKNWWKLPAGSPIPDGIQFFNDHGDHWTIEPLWPMGKDKYIGIVEQTLEYWMGPLPAI